MLKSADLEFFLNYFQKFGEYDSESDNEALPNIPPEINFVLAN
jgi:hypothetical protein